MITYPDVRLFTPDNNGGLMALSYGAIADKGRRRPTTAQSRSEDWHLKARDRRKMSGTVRQDMRDKVLLTWMINRHLDHVSRFDMHAHTGNEALDKELQGLFDWHGRRDNFDVAGRHSRNEAMRLFESCKVVDGDCAFIMLASGHIQAIEGDRIAKSTVFEDKKPAKGGLTHAQKKAILAELASYTDTGLMLDPSTGRVEKYAICHRGLAGSAMYHDHIEDAEDVLFDGYFSRFDQYRGISPLASALNTLADMHEGWEYTNLKIKLHAIFGVAIHRNEVDSNDIDDDGTASAESATSSINSDDTFNLKGVPTIMDLDESHKVETIESQTPGPNIVNYSEMMTRMILLALDIPFTMYDSMKSSFSARIADREEYEESAAAKREKNRYILSRYADWKLGQWWNTSSAALNISKQAEAAGHDLRSLRRSIEWIPAGRPWLDKAKQINGETTAIAAGLESPQRVLKARGVADWRQIINEIAEFNNFAESKGVPIMVGDPGQTSIRQVASAEDKEDDAPANDNQGASDE